jgi:hypothetical protein
LLEFVCKLNYIVTCFSEYRRVRIRNWIY